LDRIRFIAVTRPIQYAKHRSTYRIPLTIALTWIVSILIPGRLHPHLVAHCARRQLHRAPVGWDRSLAKASFGTAYIQAWEWVMKMTVEFSQGAERTEVWPRRVSLWKLYCRHCTSTEVWPKRTGRYRAPVGVADTVYLLQCRLYHLLVNGFVLHAVRGHAAE